MATQFTALKALIEHDGKILILREAPTNPDGTNAARWDIPGGRVEFGEEPFAALAREVHEETGLTVTVDRPITMAHWTPVIRGEQVQIIATYVRCINPQGDIQLSQEHDQFAWVGPNDTDHELIPNLRPVLDTYWKSRRVDTPVEHR